MAALVDAAAVVAACGVDLVVVGGAALWLHGRRTASLLDLDVVPAPDRCNLERLQACGAFLGAQARSWPTEPQLRRCEAVRVSTSYGPVDLLLRRGREEFDQLRAAGSETRVLGVPVPVAACVDVLRLKRRFKEVDGV